MNFDEAEEILEKYSLSGELPTNVHFVNSKDCYPILEHSIVTRF